MTFTQLDCLLSWLRPDIMIYREMLQSIVRTCMLISLSRIINKSIKTSIHFFHPASIN